MLIGDSVFEKRDEICFMRWLVGYHGQLYYPWINLASMADNIHV